MRDPAHDEPENPHPPSDAPAAHRALACRPPSRAPLPREQVRVDAVDPARERIVRLIPRVFALGLAAVALLELGVLLLLDRLPFGGLLRALVNTAVLLGVGGPTLWWWVVTPYRRLVLADLQRGYERQREVAALLRRQERVARFQEELEATERENDALAVAEAALADVEGILGAEVRVAPTVHAAFAEGIARGGGPRCAVASPPLCPALREGRVRIEASGASRRACTYLRPVRGEAPHAAVCVPIQAGDRNVGFLRAVAPESALPGPPQLFLLQAVAHHLGHRLGVLRALSSSERLATTDPLTGLINRRRLWERLHDLQSEGAPFCVVMGDIDRFKALNDTHGHAMGDRALRLFAHVLRSVLRPEDICARVGGEEFVVLLPGCRILEAAAVVERVRSTLGARAGGSDRVPHFTVSFGLLEAKPGLSAEDLLRRADAAMYAAKRAGRDRAMVWAPDPDSSASP